MKFRASEYQIKQIAVNACKAQLPLFYKNLRLEDIDLEDRGLVIADTVKRIIRRVGSIEWVIDDEVDPHWHGWINIYPTVQELVNPVLELNN